MILITGDNNFCQSTTIPASSTKNNNMSKRRIEHTARLAILRASFEKRLIIGLSAAIRTLSKNSANSLICFIAESEREDSATNMNITLLEAFCYENDIYVIKVDCAKKLSRISGSLDMTHPCVLIQMPAGKDKTEVDNLTAAEHALIDHCEFHWDWPDQIMELPV